METPVENITAIDEPPLWQVTGAITPTRPSLLYKTALAAVAMVLLPLIYVGLIALVAYGVYHEALNPVFAVVEMKGLGGLILYLAPLVVGAVLVFFMIKPLFARRAKIAKPIPLTRADEPELFRFIDAICGLVRAPQPREVRVNLHVNAYASLRRGLLSLFRRDLNLTIGLPLIAGLSIREFGGVLAHEFGHFAQGAGMGLNFVVRSVNNWFARVVYERDAWDERLARSARRVDFRVGVVLHLARLMVWVTRRIPWALMMVGHGISCFMSRQMEFDADFFETQIAGSDACAG